MRITRGVRIAGMKNLCPCPRCLREPSIRQTLAQSLPSCVARHQRRTARAQTVLWHWGLALCGAAGAGLAQRLGICMSGETILRLLKGRNDEPPAATPQPCIVGIGDRSFKRSHRDGTLLCATSGALHSPRCVSRKRARASVATRNGAWTANAGGFHAHSARSSMIARVR